MIVAYKLIISLPRSSDTFLPLKNITNKMPRIRRPKATAPATIPTNSPTAMFFSSSILGGVKSAANNPYSHSKNV